MQTRPVTDTTITEFDFAPIKCFLWLTPPLHYELEHQGALIPSPVKAHLQLTHGITDQAYQKAADIDYILRINHAKSTHIDTYDALIHHLTIMMNSIKYHIDHFDEEKLGALKQVHAIAEDGSNVIYYEKVEYIKCYMAMHRCKLDTIFSYIKRQRNLLNWENSRLAKFAPGRTVDNRIKRKIETNLKNAYRDAETCINQVKAYLTTMKDEDHTMISAPWKFQLYQAYLEILLYHAITEKEASIKSLKTLGAQRWLDILQSLAKEINTQEYDIEYNILRARYEQTIQKNLNHAAKFIEKADALFTEYKKNPMIAPEEIPLYTNQITLVIMSTMLEKLSKNTKDATLEMLETALQRILQAKDTIAQGTDLHKYELSSILDMILGIVEAKMRSEMVFAKLEKLEMLLKLVQLAKDSFAIFDNATTTLNCKPRHERALNDIHKVVAMAMESIKKQDSENALAATKLAEKEAAYELKFGQLMQEFETETKEILKRRKITSSNFVKVPNIHPAISTEAAVAPREPSVEKPSLAKRAKLYFRHCRLENIESLLNNLQPDDDRTEAMLYIGDKYYLAHHFDKALVMYEQCIAETQLTPIPNQEVVDAIKLQLVCTKEAIEKNIRYIELSMSLLKRMLDDFIIKLGRQQLTQQKDGADDTLSLNEKELYETTYALGYDEYIRIGRKNNAEGKGMSLPAQNREFHENNLKLLKTTLELTSTLIAKVSNQSASENFPALTKNPSTLFTEEKKTLPQAPEATMGSGKRNRKR